MGAFSVSALALASLAHAAALAVSTAAPVPSLPTRLALLQPVAAAAAAPPAPPPQCSSALVFFLSYPLPEAGRSSGTTSRCFLINGEAVAPILFFVALGMTYLTSASSCLFGATLAAYLPVAACCRRRCCPAGSSSALVIFLFLMPVAPRKPSP